VLVDEGVTLEPAPGDATRPIIKQKTPYTTCNCALLFPEPKVVIRELELDQAVVKSGVGGAGAVQIGPGDTIERSILMGADDALLDNESGATTELSDDLLIAEAGAAVYATQGADLDLDNVTAIARDVHSVALLAEPGGKTTTLVATNTIARGGSQDVEADAEAGGVATIALNYSDARTADELVLGSGAKITDTNHPTHGEPLFVSAATEDYEEASGSPTIDAGTADAASGATDLLGLPRVAGAATDIGAFEFQPPVATTKSESPGTTTKAPTVPSIISKGAPIPTPPSDSTLTLHPSRFAAASRGASISRQGIIRRIQTGTTISYMDSQSAVTTFTVLEPVPGVRSGHSCVAVPAHRAKGHRYKPCTRLRSLGSFTNTDSSGLNRLRFRGRLRGHALVPHTYLLTAYPRNSAGKGVSLTVSFTILP
jgi:hypothetical protein